MVGVGVSVATTTAGAWEVSGVFDGTGVSVGSSCRWSITSRYGKLNSQSEKANNLPPLVGVKV